MLRVHEIKINALNFKEENFKAIVEKRLRLPAGSITDLHISKESVDAREKPVIYRVFSVDIESSLPEEAIADAARRNHFKYGRADSEIYQPRGSWDNSRPRPVIAGFGPCGIFAALVLAHAGAKPIVLERGASMEVRVKAVEEYWNGGKLNPKANVQFGEGGAGTFSDGKLTTGTKSSAHSYVFDSFIKAGADPEIAYKQKPHIGTDIIRKAVVNFRKEIEALGGEVRFLSQLTGINIKDGSLVSVEVNGTESIPTDSCILALGHSARDSFQMLYESGLQMEQKPFSIGVRVEHRQEDIDMAQYGRPHYELGIGPAEYKLNCRIGDRGVYTFCMCPGGQVVDSSSEEGLLVTNGMSYAARDSEYANSAVLCDVKTEDFQSEEPLAGMYFQEKYERRAFEIGNGKLPKGEKAFEALPDFASFAIKEGLQQFGRKIKGFENPVNIYGIESRSSSPVRIKRDAKGFALASEGLSINGLYPGGEGAGYAGGIMSAAVDGIHLAELLMTSRF